MVSIIRRIAIFSCIAWIVLLTLYISLGQVTVPESFARTLRAGRSLTRMYQVRDFFPTSDPSLDLAVDRRSLDAHFALDYQFRFSHEDCDKLESVSIGKTVIPMESRARDASGDVKLSESFSVPVTTAHPDIAFTPTGDAVALTSMVFHETSIVPLRVRWDALTSTLEIWPDSNHWRKSHHGTKTPGYLSPLISIHLSKDAAPSVTFPERSISPTPLLHLRLAILTLLIPPAVLIAGLVAATYILLSTLDVVLVHVSRLIGMVVTLFVVLGIAIWISSGSPRVPLREATSMIRESLRPEEGLPEYSPPPEYFDELEKGLRADEKA